MANNDHLTEEGNNFSLCSQSAKTIEYHHIRREVTTKYFIKRYNRSSVRSCKTERNYKTYQA